MSFTDLTKLYELFTRYIITELEANQVAQDKIEKFDKVAEELKEDIYARLENM